MALAALLIIVPLFVIGPLFYYSYRTGHIRNSVAILTGVVGTFSGMFAGGFCVYNSIEGLMLELQSDSNLFKVVGWLFLTLMALVLASVFIATCWRCSLYLFNQEEIDHVMNDYESLDDV